MVHQHEVHTEAAAQQLSAPQAHTASVDDLAHDGPLHPAVRRPVAAVSGADLSMVAVHSDPAAGRSARSIGAVAFTRDQDVFVDRTALRSGSAAHRIMTHEALHAAGSRTSGPTVARRSRVAEIGDRLEWWDSAADAEQALVLVEGMAAADLDDTLADMVTAGHVGRLSFRLKNRALILRFLRVVARAAPGNRDAVMAQFPFANMSPENQLVAYGQRFAADRGAPVAAPAPGLRALIPSDPGAPFSGGGATGTSPADSPMSVPQMWTMKGQADEAKKRPGGLSAAQYTRTPGLEMLYDWSNPTKGNLTGPGSPLASWSATDRTGQAELLLRQPIATKAPGAYPGGVPSRAEVIRSAAKAHRLSPELIAAIILTEQRDQSKREDAADYQGAVMGGQNTSIGLGQVTVKTARDRNLFADLVSPSMQGWLATDTKTTTQSIAHMLASDEFNIFAVARYLRFVADEGAKHPLATLPSTAAWVPGVTMANYANDATTWTEDQVRLIGSEYTSKPWDDVLVTGWGDLVLESYRDVTAASVF